MMIIKHAVGRIQLHCTYLLLHPLKCRSRNKKEKERINKRGKGKREDLRILTVVFINCMQMIR